MQMASYSLLLHYLMGFFVANINTISAGVNDELDKVLMMVMSRFLLEDIKVHLQEG